MQRGRTEHAGQWLDAYRDIYPIGDSDSWIFSANAGETVILRVGKITQTNTFTPRITLFNPSEVKLASASDASSGAAEIAITVTNTGTFTVTVDDAVGTTATGTYRLKLAKSPGAVSVAPGDEGGAMTNGFTYLATLPLGDMDVWTFSAVAGEGFVVRMGATNNLYNSTNIGSWVRVFGPNGAQVAENWDTSYGSSSDAEGRATNSGQFTVVVGTIGDHFLGIGTYRVTLAKSGSSIVPAPGEAGGPMTNGTTYIGQLPAGDLGVWSFDALAGESFVIRMGATNNIYDATNIGSWVRVFGPNGAKVDENWDTSYGSSSDVQGRATNSGQFTVVVGTIGNHLYGTGGYRVTLARSGSPVVPALGEAGGPMANGTTYFGQLPAGDLGVWSFNAVAGEGFVVRMGATNNAYDSINIGSWIRVFGPDGVQVAEDSDTSYGSSSDAQGRANTNGQFTVVVGTTGNHLYGTGGYRVTLARSGSPVVPAPGEAGGPMTNGTTYVGQIPAGDLGVWSFDALAGESFVIRMGATNNTYDATNIGSWVRVFGSNGAKVAENWDISYGSSADAQGQATNSGQFTVVVGTIGNHLYGTGGYRVTLARSGSPVVPAPGEAGGPMTNGTTYVGQLPAGDLGVWSFNAVAGEGFVVRMGATNNAYNSTNIGSWVRVFGPNGAQVAEAWDASYGSSSDAQGRATNSGQFTVVVGTIGNHMYGTGGYLVTLARSGSPVVPTPGDTGGVLANGMTYLGELPPGDLDVWSFNAVAGEGFAVRMGATNNIYDATNIGSWVRVFGPNGAQVAEAWDTSYGSSSDAQGRATNSGQFTVVVATIGNHMYGTGGYLLTLAKTGEPIFVGPGDEGGPLSGAGVYNGAITSGDLDVWSFTACSGDTIFLRMDELTNNGPLTPYVRLIGRDGVLLNSVSGAATAQISRIAPASGNYLVVVGDLSGHLVGTGAYTLTVGNLSGGLKLCTPSISGTNAILSGVGGVPNATYVLLTTTNLAPPVLWLPISTNYFDQFGVFNVTNFFNVQEPQRFFRLSAP